LRKRSEIFLIAAHHRHFLMTLLRKLSLRVRRFFVPILGWHKPYMTDEYTSDVALALRRFRGAFIPGAMFGATRDIVTILTDVNNIPYNVSAIALDSIFTGIELSAFPLVNSICLAKLRPRLKTREETLVWTAATSLATAIAIQAIQTPVQRLYHTGTFSIKDFVNQHTAASILNFTSFTTALHGLDRTLPPPEKMGGRFARAAAVTAIADVTGTVASAPLVIAKSEGLIVGTLRRCLIKLPLTLVDYTLNQGIGAGYDRWISARLTTGY
jgi:hypothetical protein